MPICKHAYLYPAATFSLHLLEQFPHMPRMEGQEWRVYGTKPQGCKNTTSFSKERKCPEY